MGAILMSLVVGLVVLILSYIIIKLVKFIKWHREMVQVLSHFPGPKPHWLFGNAFEVNCIVIRFVKFCLVRDNKGRGC